MNNYALNYRYYSEPIIGTFSIPIMRKNYSMIDNQTIIYSILTQRFNEFLVLINSKTIDQGIIMNAYIILNICQKYSNNFIFKVSYDDSILFQFFDSKLNARVTINIFEDYCLIMELPHSLDLSNIVDKTINIYDTKTLDEELCKSFNFLNNYANTKNI